MLIEKLARFTHTLTKAALKISAIGLMVMTGIIGWQVFARYVLNDSPAWSETAALLLMLYYIMLAVAVGVYESYHLGLKVLLDRLHGKTKQAVEAFNYCLITLFGVSMVFGGFELVEFTRSHIIPTLDISRAFAYLPFAASGVLISVFALEKLFIIFANQEP